MNFIIPAAVRKSYKWSATCRILTWDIASHNLTIHLFVYYYYLLGNGTAALSSEFCTESTPQLSLSGKTNFNCICDEYRTHFSHISLRSDQLFCSRRCERVLIWQGWFMAHHLLSGHKHEPHVSRAQPPSLCTQVSLNTLFSHIQTEVTELLLFVVNHCVCERPFTWCQHTSSLESCCVKVFQTSRQITADALNNSMNSYHLGHDRIMQWTKHELGVTTCCSDISEPEHLLHVTHASSGHHVLYMPWITTRCGRCYDDVAIAKLSQSLRSSV